MAISIIITAIFVFLMFLYWTGVFFVLYHLLRFGIGTRPKKFAAMFLAGSIFLSMITSLLYGQIDTSTFGKKANAAMMQGPLAPASLNQIK